MTAEYGADRPLTGGPEAAGRPELTGSPEAVAAAADDFGHIVHRVPSAVAFPADAEAVARLVRYARGEGRVLLPRGAGHSVYGQAQTDGGIVCGMTRLNAVTVQDDGRTVDAGAGALTSAVLDAALARGMTPPVLTDYLELTVGGTLSAGGIGGASHAYGPAIDDVRELEVVTAAGERVICSADREPDVFFSVLGSEGAGGIITRARLPLVPAPRRIRACRVPCPDAGALMAAQLALVREGRFGYVEGQITLAVGGGWDFAAEIAAYADEVTLPPGAVDVEEVSYRDFCHRMVPGVRLLAATGDWYRPHPWFSAFLPAATAEGFVNAALAGLRAATVGPLPMLLYPMRRGRAPAPGLVTPGDEPFFAFTILRTTEGGDALAEALAGNGRLAAAAAAAGGAVYPISALP